MGVCISLKTIDFGQSPRSEWKKFETKSKIESDRDLLTNQIEAVEKSLPSFAKIDTIAKTYATKASVVDCATQTKLTALENSLDTKLVSYAKTEGLNGVNKTLTKKANDIETDLIKKMNDMKTTLATKNGLANEINGMKKKLNDLKKDQSGSVLFEAIRTSYDNKNPNYKQCIGGSWDTKTEYNNNNSFNYVTGVFTAPKSGYYEFQFKVRGTDLHGVKTCVSLVNVNVVVLSRACTINDPLISKIEDFKAAGKDGYWRVSKGLGEAMTRLANYRWLNLSGIIKLSTGDTFCPMLVSGGLDVDDNEFMQFSGKYIGPPS